LWRSWLTRTVDKWLQEVLGVDHHHHHAAQDHPHHLPLSQHQPQLGCDVLLCVDDPGLGFFYWAGFLEEARDEVGKLQEQKMVE
jgi:hypothetical protein